MRKIAMLIDHIKTSEKPLLIVMPHAKHHDLLAVLNKEKIIKPIQLMSKEDLLEKVFFAYNPLALYEASRYLKLKPSVVRPWLKYLYHIDTEKTYSESSINQLVALKRHLMHHTMIQVFKYKKNLFETHEVIIDGYQFDPWITPLIDAIKPWCSVRVVPHSESMFNQATYTECATVEQEIIHQCIRIQQWIDQGISRDSIVVIEPPADYRIELMSIATMFGLPLQFQTSKTLIEYPQAQHFLSVLWTHKALPLFDAFNASLEAIKQSDVALEKMNQVLIRTINPLVMLDHTVSDVYEYIEYLFTQTKVPQKEWRDAVKVVSMDDYIPKAHDHLIYMGVSEGHFPNIQADHDLLGTKEKIQLNIPTALTITQSRMHKLTHVCQSVYTVSFSHAQKNNQTIYYPSNVMDTWKETYPIETLQPLTLNMQDTSLSLDKLHAKKIYDAWKSYHTKHSDLENYYALFNRHLPVYNPQFKPLKKTTLENLLPKPLRLSYTSLNQFFGCHFRYLASALLKLDAHQSSLSLEIGKLMHSLLDTWSKTGALDDDTIDQAISQTIDSLDLTHGENYVLKHLKHQIKDMITILNHQRTQLKNDSSQSEVKLEKTYDQTKRAVLIGVIDEVLCVNHETKKNCILIDYKTGKQTLDMKKGIFGMQVQLLYYCLLYLHEHPDAIITGFYEQAVLHGPLKKGESLEDTMRLQGYTLNDKNHLNHLFNAIDDTLVKGLRTNNDGSFHAKSKVYSETDLEAMLYYLDQQIKRAIESIFAGDFSINPIRVFNDNISCEYCPFTDVCYKDHRHYRHKQLNENLLTMLQKGGD